MFKATQFFISKLWNEPRCSSEDEWNKKIWHIHTVKFYSGIRMNEIMTFEGKKADIDKIQTQKIKSHCFLLHEEARTKQSKEGDRRGDWIS